MQPLLHVCRILYALGRLSKLNFTLSQEERSALDVLGVAGVIAEFRAAGRVYTKHARCAYGHAILWLYGIYRM